MAKASTAEPNMKPAKSAKSKPAKAKKPSVFARLGQYFRDVRSEMNRVVWPNRPEVLNSSVVVLVTLVFFVIFAFLVDTVVVQALQLLSKLG